MRIVYNPDHHLHDAHHEMYRGRLVSCHETPARLDFVLEALRQRPVGWLCKPDMVSDAVLAAAFAP